MDFLRQWANACLDFLFPKSPEVMRLESLSPDELASTLPPAEAISDPDIIALFGYSHRLVRDLVWEVKYGGNKVITERLGEILSDAIREEVAERGLFEAFDSPILMPMPVSDKRRFERGWNQAELLGDTVKTRLGSEVKYMPRQLVKHLHTESQTRTATRAERMRNIKGSMKLLHPETARGRCIILIDDVTTTGATFNEARRVLQKAGARKIICFAVAH